MPEKIKTILLDPRTWAIIIAAVSPFLKDRFGITEEQLTDLIALIISWIAGETIRPTQLRMDDLKAYLGSRRLALLAAGGAVALLHTKFGLDPAVTERVVYGIAALIVTQSFNTSERLPPPNELNQGTT